MPANSMPVVGGANLSQLNIDDVQTTISNIVAGEERIKMRTSA